MWKIIIFSAVLTLITNVAVAMVSTGVMTTGVSVQSTAFSQSEPTEMTWGDGTGVTWGDGTGVTWGGS